MKPPIRRPQGRSIGPPSSSTFSPPTPMVSRPKRAKVLTAAERAAFLASRPDLKPKG